MKLTPNDLLCTIAWRSKADLEAVTNAVNAILYEQQGNEWMNANRELMEDLTMNEDKKRIEEMRIKLDTDWYNSRSEVREVALFLLAQLDTLQADNDTLSKSLHDMNLGMLKYEAALRASRPVVVFSGDDKTDAILKLIDEALGD